MNTIDHAHSWVLIQERAEMIFISRSVTVCSISLLKRWGIPGDAFVWMRCDCAILFRLPIWQSLLPLPFISRLQLPLPLPWKIAAYGASASSFHFHEKWPLPALPLPASISLSHSNPHVLWQLSWFSESSEVISSNILVRSRFTYDHMVLATSRKQISTLLIN